MLKLSHPISNEYRSTEQMPLRSMLNVTAVWLANGIAWVIALSPIEWLNGLLIVKEIVALISLFIAIGFTLYKWRQAWGGFDPRKKNKRS